MPPRPTTPGAPRAPAERIARQLDAWRRRGLGPGLVVAVSGGSDSVGLLRLLHEAGAGRGWSLSVAHFHHGVRGESADDDARFVADLAGSLNLPFDLGRWQPTRAAHFEADARRARYRWLAETARRRNAHAVAVGHTRDDQAETILHRILRGTGPRGLAGMSRRRRLDGPIWLVRPLLGMTREEVRTHLDAIGQPYRDDATNLDTTRTRARLRHDLLPRLKAEYNPRVAEALVRLGELARSDARLIERLARSREPGVMIERTPEALVLDRRAFLRIHPTLRSALLRRLWRSQGWPEGPLGAGHWRRLAAEAGREAGRRPIVGEFEIESQSLHILIRRRRPAPAAPSTQPEAVPLPVPGVATWQGGSLTATLDPAAPCDERIDLDAVRLPLLVRAPQPGDRFDPLGIPGHQPLADFLRGRKVPRERRPSIPIVCDQAGIIWVAGHRIAERVKRTAATRRTLGLSWRPGCGCD